MREKETISNYYLAICKHVSRISRTSGKYELPKLWNERYMVCPDEHHFSLWKSIKNLDDLEGIATSLLQDTSVLHRQGKGKLSLVK